MTSPRKRATREGRAARVLWQPLQAALQQPLRKISVLQISLWAAKARAERLLLVPQGRSRPPPHACTPDRRRRWDRLNLINERRGTRHRCDSHRREGRVRPVL